MLRKSFVQLAFAVVLIFSLACSMAGLSTAQPPSQQSSSSSPVAATNQPSSTSAQPQSKYFQEDFSNGAPNWSYFVIDASIMINSPGSLATLANGNVGNMTVGPSKGHYVFDLEDKGQWVYATYDAQEYDDVAVEVSDNNLGTNDNNVSLICRYTKQNGWYEFNIANNGLYNIYYAHFTPDNRVTYSLIADGGSNHIKQGKNVNQYGISCKGHTLSLTINGFATRKVDDNDYVLQSGKIGISVSSFNDLPAKVEFDWVKVSQP
jgi:hypothetical protein